MESSVDIAPLVVDFLLPVMSVPPILAARCVSLVLRRGGDRGRLTFEHSRRVFGVAINCRLQWGNTSHQSTTLSMRGLHQTLPTEVREQGFWHHQLGET